MNTSDKQFFLSFLGVLAVLVGISIIIFAIANGIGSAHSAKGEKNPAQLKLSAERIRPVGQVSLRSNPVETVASDATAVVAVNADTTSVSLAAEEDAGKKAYSGICQSCHDTGVLAAPIVGDIAAWKPRIAAGIEVLYTSAIQGKGAMAAKGGNPSLSDAEVKAAVDYMVRSSQ